MKKIFIVLTLVWFGFISNSFSADFQKGLDAARSGDYTTALKEWRPLAEEGQVDAQYNVGVLYENGYGVLQDYQEAVKWFRLAGEQGHDSAQYNLGLMYDSGKGVVQDYKEALKWYRLAAEKDNIGDTENNMARIFLEGGYGVLQDYQEAVKWYRLSAEKKYYRGMYGLGYMYLNGFGVIKDLVLAHMWWNIADSLGYERAKENKEIIVKQMTASQIEEAQRLARQCQRNEYKGC